MPLSPGTRLGAYEIVGALGAGSMGEVYRARDTKLNRDVALKVLPTEFAADADRLARFKREAQLLATVNHVNIAAIHGFEDTDGEHALVLELVDGPTLADRISQDPIPFDEALPIAQQVADALEAAHEQGIVHRDLKPANIKLRPDGTVKVLDFGLAKALDSGGTSRGAGLETASPTITTPAMTLAGVILGTAAYMSPEQAKGRAADKRSDVWAFGCVLFEMLAGMRAFEGEDVSDTLALVLRGEPNWSALPADAPPAVRLLIKGCLERDRRQRLGDIAAVQFVLRNAKAGALSAAVPSTHVPQRPLWHRIAPFAVGLIGVGALGVVVGRTQQPAARPPQVTRFAITLPAGQRFYETGGQVIAISPDGSHVAYIANQRIYARGLSELESRPVAGTEANSDRLANLTFSPDSQSLVFFVSNANATASAMKKVPLSGGTPITIGRGVLYGSEITWRDDGILLHEQGKGIARLDASGRLEQLAAVTDRYVTKPQILPDGDTLMFAEATVAGLNAPPDAWDKAKIVVQSVKSGERKTLIDGGGAPTYVPTDTCSTSLGERCSRCRSIIAVGS